MDLVKQVVLVCLACSLSLQAQQEPSLRWKPGLRLSWADFKGQPPVSQRVAAITASGLSYRYTASGDGDRYEIDFTVDTFFYPEKSWYHPGLCDALVLSHEQLHFDISELFARRLRRRLSSARFTDRVKSEVRKIFDEVNRELSEFQDQYDRETDYSRNREAQLAWNKSIARLLRELPER